MRNKLCFLSDNHHTDLLRLCCVCGVCVKGGDTDDIQGAAGLGPARWYAESTAGAGSQPGPAEGQSDGPGITGRVATGPTAATSSGQDGIDPDQIRMQGASAATSPRGPGITTSLHRFPQALQATARKKTPEDRRAPR